MLGTQKSMALPALFGARRPGVADYQTLPAPSCSESGRYYSEGFEQQRIPGGVRCRKEASGTFWEEGRWKEG